MLLIVRQLGAALLRVFLTFLTVLSVSVAAAFAEGDTAGVAAIVEKEQKALGAIPAKKLNNLVKKPAASLNAQKIYDAKYIASLPKASGGPQWKCLAQALYFEARGESIKGQVAVAEVILNRVDSNAFPDTLCAVINQGTGRKFACQFTYTCDGLAEHIGNPKAYRRVGKVARLMMDGAPRELTAGATFYHTKAVKPKWSRKFHRTATIGVHHFYRKHTQLSSNN